MGLIGFDGEEKNYIKVGKIPEEFELLKIRLKTVVEFKKEHFQNLYDKLNVLLITNDEKTISDYKEVGNSNEFAGKFNFFYSSANNNLIIGFIKEISLKIFPCITLFSSDLFQKYEIHENLNKENMINFFNNYKNLKMIVKVKNIFNFIVRNKTKR
jgi:hypothetical protein